MGVKAEMPEAALVVGQHRVYRRVIQEQHTLTRLALVVLVDRVDQARGGGRGIALGHDGDVAVDGRTQPRQCLLGLALAVEAHDLQRTVAAGQLHAAAGVDALGRPDQVSEHRLAGVGKRAREALDHADADGFPGRLGPDRVAKKGRRASQQRDQHAAACPDVDAMHR